VKDGHNKGKNVMEVVARFVRNVLNGGDVGVVLSCVVYGGC